MVSGLATEQSIDFCFYRGCRASKTHSSEPENADPDQTPEITFICSQLGLHACNTAI